MKEIQFPDWDNPTAMLISSRNTPGKRTEWSKYENDARYTLALRVTVEIAGGLYSFEHFDSKEAEEAAWLERDRRTAWRNAIRFAEQLHASASHREYVVKFRPESPNVGREAVCIYQRLDTAICKAER